MRASTIEIGIENENPADAFGGQSLPRGQEGTALLVKELLIH
jgi:hypothetical protein